MDVVLDQNSSGTNVKYINGLGIDNKLGRITGSSTEYFLKDHLGSTTAISDSLGLITEQNSYDSFGNPTNSTFSTRYQYTGREYDDFSGLYYYRARWYSSELGRFISEDPIGFDGGNINIYVYVENNPLMKIDPLGLESFGEMQIFLGNKGEKLVSNYKEKEKKFRNCYNRNKFSSLFSGSPYLQTGVEYVEVGSLTSLSLDGVATVRKHLGPRTKTFTSYGSGINMVSKDTTRMLGFPKIAGSPLFKYLRPIGDKATPLLAVAGAFTLSYNETISFQCVCGVLE